MPVFAVAASCQYRPVGLELNVRAWIENADRRTLLIPTDPAACTLRITDEDGVLVAEAAGETDPAGAEYVMFTVPVALAAEHAYRGECRVSLPSIDLMARGHLPMPTIR